MISLVPMFFAFAVCAAILFMLLRTGWAWSIATDVPNQRSLHTRPTPRVGGWGMVPSIAIAIWLFTPDFGWIGLGAVLLAVVSQIDDRHGLSARIRFGAHLIVVSAFLVIYPLPEEPWALAFIAFSLIWLINLYNFMDGVDGLAGGMAALGFAAYAFAALPEAPQLASLASVISAAALAFLLFNLHPARIFLGDVGSIPLGFLAGALGYWGWRASIWPIWFPAMIFSPFIADTSITLLRRLLRGEKFWQAHREHYYQRVVQMGFGHARTAWASYLLAGTGIMIALLALRMPVRLQWVFFTGWIAVLGILGCMVDRCWLRFNNNHVQG